MQSGALAGGDVSAFTSRILVEGVERPMISWDIDRELNGDLPDQVVAVSGINQATGSIVWGPGDDVTEQGRNPWNKSSGWIPSRGERVEIFVSDGVTEWKQFHGVIDRTTGNLSEGFQSTIIDDWDKLSVSFTHPAMLRIMPPLAWDGSEPYRSAGLHPLYYVDRALRGAGFFATPPRGYDTALYVPLQGSRWPHYGQLKSATGFLNTVTPWGLGARDGQAEFLPSSTQSMIGNIMVSVLVAPDHASTADVFLDFGSASNHIRLSINASRVAIVLKNGVEVCRLPLGQDKIVSVLCKNGQASIRTESGAEATGSFTPSGGVLSVVRLNCGANASVAGLQVSHPVSTSHEHSATRWTPNASLDAGSLYLTGIMDAAPTFEGVPTSEMLDEINKATLSAMWIDETGIMRWVSSYELRRRESSRTVTTLDDILSLDWEDGLLATASKVTVKGKQPAITKGRWRNLVLARGSGDSLKSGDELSIFLEPESDTDWITPSTDFIEVGGSGNIWGSYNNPAYSAVGLYYTADGGTSTVAGLNCTISTEVLGLQKILVKYVAGTWPSDVEGVVATSPTNENLWPKNRGKDLPRLVGRGKIQWSDQEVTATGAGGPGPELVHDVGVWANRADSKEMLERYAAYIQSQTATPKPTITGLSITPDPRLQLGDVVTIGSPKLMGVSLKALIVGVSNSFGERFDQSLSVRIISTATSYTTYAEYNDSLGGNSMSYQQWQALGPLLQTYTEFNNH